MKPIVIIGSGIAGYTLAKTLRTFNSKKPVILITKDNGDYYSKPMLSNAFSKTQDLDNLVLMSAQEIVKNYSLELRNNCVVNSIDSTNGFVSTTLGVIYYDKLVLACGALPKKLPLFPMDSHNIFSINSLEDYKQFRTAITDKKSIIILGSGLVGCEFANDLAQAGLDVTVVSMNDYPLQSFIPQVIGLKLKQQLSILGVNWHLSTHITSVISEQKGFQIYLSNGKVLTTELILSAIGLEPNIDLAKKSGIKVNRGIVVDAYLRTNYANIYGLGDCIEIEGCLWPFISPIRQESQALARTLLGQSSKVNLSNLVITVKTPSYPITFSSDLNNQKYQSKLQYTEGGIIGTYSNYEGKLKAFILTQQETLKTPIFREKLKLQ